MNLLLENRAADIPLMKACDSLAINRSTVYWGKRHKELSEDQKKQNLSRKHCEQFRALSLEERTRLLALFNSEEFIDQPPMEMYHTLLERGENLCSISTMHRLLRDSKQNGERRLQRAPQSHAIPRLSATQPNEVWSWDCSKLRTHTRGLYLTLYVVLDLYSRFAVAWMISRKENSALAQQLMDEATHRYSIQPNQLTIHQDRGSPMIAHRYIDLMGELGVTLSHSRPRVSNDNAISEAQFKTQKYQPDYPQKFHNAAHANKWCADYFDWYNFSHHHSGLAGFTPEQVFTGRYKEVALVKQQALDERYKANPERFVQGRPTVAMPPEKVLINPLSPEEIAEGVSDKVNFATLNRVKEKSTLTLN